MEFSEIAQGAGNTVRRYVRYTLRFLLSGPHWAWLQTREWAWFGGLFLGGFGVASMNEFGLAAILFLLGALSAGRQLWSWRGVPEMTNGHRRTWKAIGYLGIVVGLVCLLGVLNVYRAGRAWSQLPQAYDAAYLWLHPTQIFIPSAAPGYTQSSQLDVTIPLIPLQPFPPSPPDSGSGILPLSIRAYLQPPEPYQAGTLLGGIVWEDGYEDVRLDLANGPEDIRNVDFLVGLDTSIAGMGQLSQFPGITEFPDTSFGGAWIVGTDAKGRPLSVPMVQAPGMMNAAPVYRVHADHIFADTVVHFVIASLALSPPTVRGDLPKNLFAPKRPPQVIRVKGVYESGGKDERQKHPIEFSAIFNGSK